MKSHQQHRQESAGVGAEDDLFLPTGVSQKVAERLAIVLDELYPTIEEEGERYRATKHLLWAAMAIMINRKLPASKAVQTVLSVMVELLVDGLGAAAAVKQLRQMADARETDATVKSQRPDRL